ncbi:MAG: hypothetical protein K9N05_02300 [Candidatus Marinimicrobia bacterium]|nr:hypothetical protein [Candidatus Neomarinimicrobiota bacterium]
MKQFLLIVVSLVMFFTAGVQLDFGDAVQFPEWVESVMSDDDGGMINMTSSPIYKIARTHFSSGYDELEPMEH